MTIEIVLAIVTVFYILQAGIFLIGLRKPLNLDSAVTGGTVSVIIAARDEELNISDCLQSVADQSYPISLYEIIIIDDGSTDGTKRICEEFVKRYPNIKLIESKDDTYIRGKANALAQGIEASTGEIILITDADCSVPRTWVEYTANRYDDKIGLLGGFTLQKAKTPFEGMQSLDWTFILGMAAATARLKHPLGSIGNNLSFRRTAYDEIGGYRKLKFSVTEDYTVVQAIVGSKKWKYLYPLDLKLLVESKSCPDFRSLIRQKHRWGKGGLDMKPAGLVIMVVGFFMHITPFIMLSFGGVWEAFLALTIKFTADYIFLYNILDRFDRKDDLRWFPWFEIYFLFYVLIFPFLVFFGGKVKWKGREF